MRNKRLDVLRCIAVLAVFCHHSGPHYNGIIPVFNKIGWAGVDLFFVLSGFLISGLLFAEYKKIQSIRIGRFLLRRGLKIYPSFYVFLIGAGIVSAAFSRTMVPQKSEVLHEVFFVQNYLPSMWGHTWSLAVEEHFYILLPIFLALLIRYSRNRENPFQLIPFAFGVVAIISILSRALFLLVPQKDLYLGLSFTATNSRMDALFFGVLLSYFHHFNHEELKAFFLRHKLALGLFSVALLSTPLIFARKTPGFVVFGYTGMYIGFGVLLMLSLFVHDVLPKWLGPRLGAIGTAMALLGTYSYSIYLWHLPMLYWTPAIAKRVFHVELSPWTAFAVYLATGFAFGILMARLIEFPVLKIRDRVIPAKVRDIAIGHSFLIHPAKT